MTKILLPRSCDFQNGKNYIGVHFNSSFRAAGKSELESNAFSIFLNGSALMRRVLGKMCEWEPAHS